MSNIYIIGRLYGETNSCCIPFPATRHCTFFLSLSTSKSIGCHSLCHCEQDGRVDAQLLKNTPTRERARPTRLGPLCFLPFTEANRPLSMTNVSAPAVGTSIPSDKELRSCSFLCSAIVFPSFFFEPLRRCYEFLQGAPRNFQMEHIANLILFWNTQEIVHGYFFT